MKIIINESQLDKFIDNYITSQLGNLTKKEEKVKSSVDRWVFKNKEGDDMMILNIGEDNVPKVAINDNIYKNIVNLFGLNGEYITTITSGGKYHFSKIQHYLITWVKNHMGLDVKDVDTYADKNGGFIY